jgi:phosphate uptake regulator
MHIDQHRERLRDRIALQATLLEGAYVAAVAAAADRADGPSGRTAMLHDDMQSVAEEAQAEATEFLVRFRPVASDLHFATSVLGCSADLQAAAVAAARIDVLHGDVERRVARAAVPSLDRLASCVYVVVSLMADAVAEWDPSAVDAVTEAQGEVAAVREKLRGEVAAAVVRLEADADTVLRIDTIACLLERIAAASAACTRRLSRTGAPGQASLVVRA